MESAGLLRRLHRNDASLRVLRVTAALLTTTADGGAREPAAGAPLGEALRHHTHLRTLLFAPGALPPVSHWATRPLWRRGRDAEGPAEEPIVAPPLAREQHWAALLQACYHLPLRALHLDGLQLSPAELEHVLELVSYVAGVAGCGIPADRPRTARASGTLTCLDLSGNTMPEDTARRLGRLLGDPSSTLQSVHLSECRLGDAGVEALLGAVEVLPPALQVLSLRWNGLTQGAEAVLLRCLEGASRRGTALRMALEGNPLSTAGADVGACSPPRPEPSPAAIARSASPPVPAKAGGSSGEGPPRWAMLQCLVEEVRHPERRALAASPEGTTPSRLLHRQRRAVRLGGPAAVETPRRWRALCDVMAALAGSPGRPGGEEAPSPAEAKGRGAL